MSLSRYLHLNPVAIQRLGLDKAAKKARKQGLGECASQEVIQARLELLRSYPWSSYRAFAGHEKPPAWLDCDSVLALGGGMAKERRRLYRQDCEAAVSDEEPDRPWEGVVGGLALGSQEFLEKLLGNSGVEDLDREARARLMARPSFPDIVRMVEELKSQPWAAFRDRRGDWGRDLALYLGRELGAMTLAELGQAVEASSRMTVSVALRRFRERLSQDKSLRKRLAEAKN